MSATGEVIADAMRAIPAVQVAAGVEALRSALNFIENTESELGVVLGCGDKARTTLAAMKKE